MEIEIKIEIDKERLFGVTGDLCSVPGESFSSNERVLCVLGVVSATQRIFSASQRRFVAVKTACLALYGPLLRQS